MTERDVWQDVQTNSEGLSVTTYSQAMDQQPVVEDECWFTWDELDELKEIRQTGRGVVQMTNRESDRYPELTEEEIDTCYKVLEIVREDFNEAGMVAEENLINDAHTLVQRFDEGVNWVDPIEVNE